MKPYLPYVVAGLIVILGLSAIQTTLERANKRASDTALVQCTTDRTALAVKRLHESITSDALVCQEKLNAAASDAASCLDRYQAVDQARQRCQLTWRRWCMGDKAYAAAMGLKVADLNPLDAHE